MTKRPTKGKGVPLQFDGSAATKIKKPTSRSTDAQAAPSADLHGPMLSATGSEPTIALSSAAEVQAVATLTEQALAFTDQLSRAQRDTSVGLILMCTAMLSVYALFGVMA